MLIMSWILKKDQLFKISWVLIIVIGVLIIILLGVKTYSLFSENQEEKDRVNQTTYQAVFLENDQIYFGKLKNIDSQYPILDEVYYIKLEGEGATSGQLVKLGETEPHGPESQMIINRDHILFWENLRDDSRIVQTIRSLKLQ